MNSQNHNILLKEKYASLSSLQKNNLASDYKNSPLVLKLIQFVGQQKASNFSTRSCIEYVYGANASATDYKIIENRFFKLRKKLLDSLAGDTGENTKKETPDEEMELRECIDLFNKGQKDLAFKRLELLEQVCWKKNLFELLPRVIDRLIFCNQSFNKLENNKVFYKRYDLAIKLNADTQQVLKTVRLVYEINYLKGITAAKNEMRFIKNMADKHSAYPRFNFIYHYVSLYYKLGSGDYINKMSVLGKHHLALKKIYQAAGRMTVFYIPNYEYYQEIHLKEISMFYYYNRCLFEEAYTESEALKKFVSDNNAPKAEAFFYNAFRIELACGRYQEAKQTIGNYAEVLRKNNQVEKLPFVYTLQMMLYVYAYPKIKLDTISYTENMLGQYLKWSKKNKNVLTPYEEALIVKMGYNYINGRYKENTKILKANAMSGYFENESVYKLYWEFIHFGQPTKKNTISVEGLKEKIRAMQFKVHSPNSVLLLKRMLSFLES